MSLAIRLVLGFLGIGLLVSVRVIESSLFYDPLIAYYHGDFQNSPLPSIDVSSYLFSLIFRFLINSLISIGIIYVVFQNKMHLKLSVAIYALVGLILIVFLTYQISNPESVNPTTLFYNRRILMHPLLLFVLIPALYFQDLSTKQTAE